MYIKNIENIAKESYQVLKPDGILLISVTHPLKWISESIKSETKSINYKGYLSDVEIDGKIAGDDNLKLKFINRTFENYINTFTKNGFLLDTIVETGVPDSFVIKYPSYLEFQKKPYRLNMRFIKR
jgi:SAM-dependent methyltransferase